MCGLADHCQCDRIVGQTGHVLVSDANAVRLGAARILANADPVEPFADALELVDMVRDTTA
jgi:hypothetical protein